MSCIAALSTLRDQFAAESYVELPSWVSVPVVDNLSAEIGMALDRHGQRRDLLLPTTGMSARRFTIATRDALAQHAPTVMKIYRAPLLLAFLGAIADEVVVPVPYIAEEFIATRLERSGDTHGWHWDDYSYALVWVVCSAPDDGGGTLEFITNVDWDKRNPHVERLVSDRVIEQRRPQQGCAYLLRSNTTLHRVAPLTRDAKREVLIFSYSTTKFPDIVRHETLEALM